MNDSQTLGPAIGVLCAVLIFDVWVWYPLLAVPPEPDPEPVVEPAPVDAAWEWIEDVGHG